MASNPFKAILHKTVLWIENTLAKLLSRLTKRDDRLPVIETYLGYSTTEHVIVRGRVLRHQRQFTPEADQSKWVNFKQMASLFMTDEIPHHHLRIEAPAGDVHTSTDEEGYFNVALPRAQFEQPENAQNGMHASRWIDIRIHDAKVKDEINKQGNSATAQAYLSSSTTIEGVISDIDDTVLKTGAWKLSKNLWTSLTGNVATREIYEDGKALINQIHAGKNPVYYVSSSPWNLYAFLVEILFKRGELIKGPLFLRDLGISKDQFITGTHGDHKGGAIQDILDANPQLRFTLMGDLGQEDAHIYHGIAEQNPDRIRAVYLKQPVQGILDASEQRVIDAMQAKGIAVTVAERFV